MKEFSKHVQDAAEMFLKRRGYEILDTNWECPDGEGKFDIVADDEDSIVFVQVKGRDGRVEGFGFDEATMQRDDFERMSMSYLAENPGHLQLRGALRRRRHNGRRRGQGDDPPPHQRHELRPLGGINDLRSSRGGHPLPSGSQGPGGIPGTSSND